MWFCQFWLHFWNYQHKGLIKIQKFNKILNNLIYAEAAHVLYWLLFAVVSSCPLATPMCPLGGWLMVCLAGGCPLKTLNPNPNLEAIMCCSLSLRRTRSFWAMGDFLGILCSLRGIRRRCWYSCDCGLIFSFEVNCLAYSAAVHSFWTLNQLEYRYLLMVFGSIYLAFCWCTTWSSVLYRSFFLLMGWGRRSLGRSFFPAHQHVWSLFRWWRSIVIIVV